MVSGQKVVVYGSSTCEDTAKARQFLDSHNVPYQYVEIEGDPEAEARVKGWNNGNRVTPTVLIGGRVLAEPGDEELAQLLGLQGA
ncbi:MAG: glutaredoxin family protein [Dehalococcoidia bacterium]